MGFLFFFLNPVDDSLKNVHGKCVLFHPLNTSFSFIFPINFEVPFCNSFLQLIIEKYLVALLVYLTYDNIQYKMMTHLSTSSCFSLFVIISQHTYHKWFYFKYTVRSQNSLYTLTSFYYCPHLHFSLSEFAFLLISKTVDIYEK